MKHLFLLVIACFSISVMNAQQGMAINSDASQPNASAMLDVKSTTKGFLLPRMTFAQRVAIAAPAAGLQVFQTDSTRGIYYHNGSTWLHVASAGANLTGWSTTGNAAINAATNFIGTTDSKPFIGKANGQQVFRFSSASTSTLIGYQASKADGTGGNENHIIGYKAGFNNKGFDNHFDGYQAGYKNTTGYGNQFIGFKAGFSNTTGTDNLFIGTNSGYNNTTLNGNHFIGNGAGFSNTTGTDNHFNGYRAGEYNTTGANNHFDGNQAGYKNTDGSNNQFEGFHAGYNNTVGGVNLFIGSLAGYSNITGSRNFAFGYKAGYSNTIGNSNIFYGLGSGFKNENGSYNTYVGHNTGYENISGNGNVALGYNAGYNETGNNKLYIANSATASPLVYGEFDNSMLKVNGNLQVSDNFFAFRGGYMYNPSYDQPALTLVGTPGGKAIMNFRAGNDGTHYWSILAEPLGESEFQFANEGNPVVRIKYTGNMVINGKLTELSDKNLKTNIVPLKSALSKLVQLKGYTYNWIDARKSREEQIGLIAQEVEAQFPQLVDTDKNGTKSVSYTHMVPVLVESIKEQQAIIDDLTKQNQAILKRLDSLEKKN